MDCVVTEAILERLQFSTWTDTDAFDVFRKQGIWQISRKMPAWSIWAHFWNHRQHRWLKSGSTVVNSLLTARADMLLLEDDEPELTTEGAHHKGENIKTKREICKAYSLTTVTTQWKLVYKNFFRFQTVPTNIVRLHKASLLSKRKVRPIIGELPIMYAS